MAIVAGIGLIVVNQGNEAPLIGQLNAEASVNAWFDAYNAGNDEAVFELMFRARSSNPTRSSGMRSSVSVAFLMGLTVTFDWCSR